jgi:hypothetical protein
MEGSPQRSLAVRALGRLGIVFPDLRRVERRLDEQTKLIRAMSRTITEQSVQLKALRDAQHDAAGRLAKAVDRLAERQEREHRQLRDAIAASDRHREHSLRADGERHKTAMKWRTTFTRQLNAIIRRLFLNVDDVPYPQRLATHRFQLRSQHEEDGYLMALLQAAGPTDRRFVEIGCGRSGGTAAVLAFECGWSGLMIDANPDAIVRLSRLFSANDQVVPIHTEVTPSNVNDLLRDHGMTGEIDLLSIDIDSYDYWVLDALSEVSPRVLVLEYNAGFGPERSVTIPLGQSLQDVPKGYSGASLVALTTLAARKGYRLIACEYSGANAFYLRHDVAPEVPALEPARAYRPQLSRVELDEERELGPEELLRRIDERRLPLVEV